MKSIRQFALAPAAVLLMASLAAAQDEQAANPLDEVTREMKVASGHLAKTSTDKPTQKSQEDAVAKLDKLILELEEKKKRRGTGPGGEPNSPAEESQVRQGPGGMGDLRPTRAQGDRWGELPAHERDRILQSLTEGFPPHYQAVLEAYYKRLAVEKRAEVDDPTASAKPAAGKAESTSKPDAKMQKSPATETPAKMTQPMKSSK